MSGHSRWSTIKRKKGKADAERGRAFTRLIKEITVAARDGGGDPEGNPRLRSAIAAARSSNMPADNIKRGILKGTGQLPGVTYESVTYEGYGPGGVALMLEVLTDNKNRTVADVRHLLSMYGGNLGATGCVAWIFDQKGVITIDTDAVDEDSLIEIAMEAGAEDVTSDSGAFEVVCDVAVLDDVRKAIEEKEIKLASAEVTMIQKNTVRLESESEAASMLKLLDLLEEHDDVQKVYSNFDVDEVVMEKLAG